MPLETPHQFELRAMISFICGRFIFNPEDSGLHRDYLLWIFEDAL